MSTVDDSSSESGIRKAEQSKCGGETGGEVDSSSESGNMRAEQSNRGGETGLGGARRGLKV